MQLYKESGRILKLVDEKRGSPKSLIFSSSYQNKRKLYTLVIESIKYDNVLKQILESSRLMKLERSVIKDPMVAHCLLYDHLFNKGGLNGTGKLQDAILRHSAALKAELVRLKVKAKVATDKDLLSNLSEEVKLPRYVRVNTLRSTIDDVVRQFKLENYRLIDTSRLTHDSYLEVLRKLKAKEFAIDIHIPQLLVFAAGTDLHKHLLYLSGDIIFQDKASCLPAIVLNPPAGSHVIDCCAAPGNKTTLLAALMNNKGKVFAFDKDASRLSTLNTLVLRAGVVCVTSSHQDFLRVDPLDHRYENVEYILVDPSCSGTGIVNRLKTMEDLRVDQVAIRHRLKSLASFQIAILAHALNFPNARRVVYSTCSVNDEENEQVVCAVITAHAAQWMVVPVLPEFMTRGNVKSFPDGAESCVRFSPAESLSNGFFVACFERRIGDCGKERKKSDLLCTVNETSAYTTSTGLVKHVNECSSAKLFIESKESRNVEKKRKDCGDCSQLIKKKKKLQTSKIICDTTIEKTCKKLLEFEKLSTSKKCRVENSEADRDVNINSSNVSIEPLVISGKSRRDCQDICVSLKKTKKKSKRQKRFRRPVTCALNLN